MLSFTSLPQELIGIAIIVFVLFLIGLVVWILLLQEKIKRTQDTLNELFKGTRIPNLEELLLNQARNLKTLDKDIQELYTISNQINNLALRGVHKFASIRFNPFKDVGGDQSFSIAFLNGKNNGVVITSLYTREGTRVYSKAITNGESEKYPLTEEEKQVLKLAIAQESNNKKFT